MTSVNVTTTKNTVTVNGETRVVTVKTAGPQGTFTDGNLGDVTVSSNGTAIAINTGAVTSSKILDGTIVNADINASAAIAGTKISPTFGSQNISTTGTLGTGDITISKAFNPSITFNDGNNENDFEVSNAGGLFRIRDIDAGFNRFTISSASGGNGGVTSINNHLDVGNGLDVTGDMTVSGTVDSVDLSTYQADGGSYLRSDADDSFTGTLTGISDNTNPVIQLNGSGPNFIRFDRNTGQTSDSIDLIYRTTPNTLAFERVSDSQIMFSVDADDQQAIFNGNVDCNAGLDVSGGDITGTLGSGVIGTTQSAGDNSTKIATTAYTDTAISNLVDSSPDALNTLNELAAALGDDANFSTTVTNSIADKLPLAGGTLTGDLTIDKNNPVITFTDNNNPDYQVGNVNGVLRFQDITNNATRFQVNTDGHIDFLSNCDFASGIDVTGDITSTGSLTITNANPIINFVDDGEDPDYRIVTNSGQFKVQDTTNSNANRLIIQQANTRITNNLLADGGISVTGEITGTSHIDLPDDAIIKLGDNDEFQIVHQDSNNNSIIKENGGGGLSIQSNGTFINLYDINNNRFMANFNTGSSCQFRFGADIRLATSSTGIDVTGGVTYSTTSIASGTLEFASTLASYDPTVGTSGSDSDTITAISLNHGHRIAVNKDGFIRNVLKVRTSADGYHIDIGQSSTGYIGDIRLLPGSGHKVIANYDGSPKLETTATGVTVDGNIGVGTASASFPVHVFNDDTGTNNQVRIEQDGTGDAILGFALTGVRAYSLGIDNSDSDKFKISSATNLHTNTLFTIDGANERVGIGTTSPTNQLHIYDSANANDQAEFKIESFRPTIRFKDRSTSQMSAEITGDNSLKFKVSAPVDDDTPLTTRMTINTDGTVDFAGNINLTSTGASKIINNNDNFFVQASGGTLYLQAVNDENGVKIHPNDKVELFYDGGTYGTAKLATSATGVDIEGNVVATANLRNLVPTDFWNSGTHIAVGDLGHVGTHGGFEFTITSGGYRRQVNGVGKWKDITVDGQSGFGCQVALSPKTGKIHLRSNSGLSTDDNNPSNAGLTDRLVVDQGGITVTGGIGLSGALLVGNEINMFNGTTNSHRFIDCGLGDNNDLRIRGCSGGDANHENMIVATRGASVRLHHDGATTPKLETAATGVDVNGMLEIASAGALSSTPSLYIGNSASTSFIHTGQLITANMTAGQQNILVIGKARSTKQAAFIGYKYSSANSDNNLLTFNHWGANELVTINGQGDVVATGTITCTSLTETSDIALKENIQPLSNILDKVKQLTGYKYNFKNKEKASMGVIAQDVEKVFPELVHGEEGKKSLQYSGLVGALIEAVKELSAKVAVLESK